MPSPLPLIDATRSGAKTVALPAPGSLPARTVAANGLIDRLRGSVSERPAVDPGLAGGLRAWLEDGTSTAPDRGRLIVEPGPRSGLTVLVVPAAGMPGQPARQAPCRRGAPPRSGADLRAILLRTVLRLTLTAGPPRAPFEDALAALAVSEWGGLVVEDVGRLSRHRGSELREVVRHGATGIAHGWAPPPAAWLPRTGDRVIVPLAGGRVVLQSDSDLVLGAPSAGRASVCMMRALPGDGTLEGGKVRRFLMLLETLRSGAAPFRVASYDLDRGRLVVDDVTEATLSAAVQEVLALLRRRLDASEGAR